MLEIKPDTVVQGHGEVILRGERWHLLFKATLIICRLLKDKVNEVIAARGIRKQSSDQIDIESCGKSRIPLKWACELICIRRILHKLYQELRDE